MSVYVVSLHNTCNIVAVRMLAVIMPEQVKHENLQSI